MKKLKLTLTLKDLITDYDIKVGNLNSDFVIIEHFNQYSGYLRFLIVSFTWIFDQKNSILRIFVLLPAKVMVGYVGMRNFKDVICKLY